MFAQQVLGASQLLRVYLDYDLLQPAAQLLLEYLEALMGVLQGQDAPVFGLRVTVFLFFLVFSAGKVGEAASRSLSLIHI